MLLFHFDIYLVPFPPEVFLFSQSQNDKLNYCWLFHATGFFLYPLQISENLYKKKPVGWN